MFKLQSSHYSRHLFASYLALSALAAAQDDADLEFLKKHMPDADKNTVSEALIENNLKFAYKAREEFPWAAKVPKDIFLNDVLPYALLDERRDDWRGDFYQRFKKIVEPAKTQLEAIALINNAIAKEVGVEYSTKRKKPNQSPYESIELGMASCTGLSILLADAFRSVGIPARVAGTPSWTTKRGNHNWVEVWLVLDQSWHFTEYYPNAKGLDHSWFVTDAEKADAFKLEHRIYASSWKKTKQHFPMVWDWKSKEVSGVDVTARYLSDQAEDVEEGIEVRVEALAGTHRVALQVQFYADGKLLFEGMTPKPIDDANSFLTSHSNYIGEVTAKWKSDKGTERSQTFQFKEQNEPRLLQLKLK